VVPSSVLLDLSIAKRGHGGSNNRSSPVSQGRGNGVSDDRVGDGMGHRVGNGHRAGHSMSNGMS